MCNNVLAQSTTLPYPSQNPSSFGSKLIRIFNAPITKEGLINGGVYILDKKIYSTLTPANKNFSIEKDFLKTYNKESGFSLINNFNNKNFIIVFLPIKLSDKDNLGYLIATYENTQYDKIFKAQYLEIILVNIITS